MKWLDGILGRLNLVDWVIGFVHGIAVGDVLPRKIAIPNPHCEPQPGQRFWNQREVINILKSYHIDCYQFGFDEQTIWLHVPQRQARWAEYLLLRAGAPVVMDTVDERNAGWASNPKHGGHMPPRWADKE